MSALFGTGQHKVDVGIAVGDESLDAVQIPALVLFTVRGLEHDRLQVGARVGLGQVHRHRFARAYARDETHALVFVAELVERFGAVLQAPQVLEACIGRADHVGSHDVGHYREVEAAKPARHGHTHQAGLAACLKVARRAGGIRHAAALAHRTVVVHTFGVGSYDFGTHFTHNLKHLVVAVHCVGKVHWGIVVFVLVGKVALLEFNYALHQRVIQMMP